MNRESFQNDEVASVLNTAFTAIKMDREQYPDADQYYNNLLVAAGGTAGWPLSAILMPDGTPAWIGNYVTKDRLLTLLRAFAGHFERGSPSLESQSNIYRSLITADFSERSSTTRLSSKPLDLKSLGEALLAQQDPIYGGVAGAQKFPNPNNVETLWFFYDETGDMRYQEAALRHLNGMLDGEIYDFLYGGFFRYSTTSSWGRPHFEKMLHTQAGMLKLLADAYKRTHLERFRRAADDLVQFVIRDLYDQQSGIFFSAIDSEYSGKEGFRYLIDTSLAEGICQKSACSAIFFKDGYSIITTKDFVPKNLLVMRTEVKKSVGDFGLQPAQDDKAITEWNALMLSALLTYQHINNNADTFNRIEIIINKLNSILADALDLAEHHLPRQLIDDRSPEGSIRDAIAVLHASVDMYRYTGKAAHEFQAHSALNHLVCSMGAALEGDYCSKFEVEEVLALDQSKEVLTALRRYRELFPQREHFLFSTTKNLVLLPQNLNY